jgi:VCBS repeat-containing protein
VAKNLRAFVGQLWKSLKPGKQPQLTKKSRRPQIELLEDRTVPTGNFGTVQGFAFLDANNNGILNVGDARLAGVKVTLVGTSPDISTTPAIEGNTSITVTATTNSAGLFKFTNVPEGTYKLQTAVVPGLSKGAAQTFTGVTITTNGQIFSHDFRYVGGVVAGSLSLRQFTTNATSASYPYGKAGTGTAVGDNKPTVKTPIAPVSTTSSSANTVLNLAKNFKDLDMTNSTVTFHIKNGKFVSGGIATAIGTGGADPIAITTASAHGLTTGASVTISGVTGFAEANNTFTITVVNATKFTLNGTTTAGSGTGGTWSSLITQDFLIKLTLFDAATPQTVLNFFNYVISDAWDDSVFHRNAKKAVGGIGVLQGGAVTVDDTGKIITDVPVSPTGSKVPNEFLASLKNLTGTIAMAQSGGDINSATNQFFFNTVNNSTALDPQKFVVFGKVADAASMNALLALANTATKDLTGGAFASAHPTVLANAFPISGYNGVTGALATAIGTGGGPISITTATAHGLVTGDKVTISGVSGFAAANGSFTVTVVDSTHFTLNGVTTIGNGTGGTFSSVSHFPTDAVLNNYMRITDISIVNRKEFLTYSLVGVNGGGNTQVASASINNGYLTIDPLSAGTTTFTVMASDRYGATVTSTFTVTVTGNAAPVAADGTLTANEDTPATGTLNATDVDAGNTLTFTLESQPSKGAVVLNNTANGNYTFSPGLQFHHLAAGETEQVTFTFKATDNLGVSSLIKTVTVTVTGINDAPIANDGTATTDQDTPVSGTLTATDVDDSIVSYTIVDAPSKGTVMITDAATGAYTFDPDSDFDDLAINTHTTVTFTFKATDENGVDSTPKTITVTVNGRNDPPAGSDGTLTTDKDTTVNGFLSGSDPDTGDMISFVLADLPLKGVVTLIDADTGEFEFDPSGEFDSLNHGESEQVTFTYNVVDNHGATSQPRTVTVTVTGLNAAPVASNGVLAADADALAGGTLAATDADMGDTLTYAVVAQPSKGAVALIDPSTGAYTFDPGNAFVSLAQGETEDVTFTFSATDHLGAVSNVATVTVTVTGVNDPPAANDAPLAANPTTPVQGTLTGSDPDTGDTITFSIDSQPSKGLVTLDNATTGLFTFDPDGAFSSLPSGESEVVTFTFTTIDNHTAASTTATITVTVTAP